MSDANLSEEEQFVDATDYVRRHRGQAFKDKLSKKAILGCYCTKYREKLVFVGNRVCFRVFKTANGKAHQCFKFKHGEWVNCPRLRLV